MGNFCDANPLFSDAYLCIFAYEEKFHFLGLTIIREARDVVQEDYSISIRNNSEEAEFGEVVALAPPPPPEQHTESPIRDDRR